MRRCKTIRFSLYVLHVLLLAVLAACGDDASQKATKLAPVREDPARAAMRDSIRRRANNRLLSRPDTLGMRADSSRVLGAATASVFVIVTSDFACPACRDLALNVLPELRKEFVNSGRVRLAFINYPQDRYFNARFAALAALCAGSAGHFWEMHDQLFINQPSWERLDDPRDFMHELAIKVGVPAKPYTDCMSRNRMLHQLGEDISRSRETGIAEVPTVYVGDRRLETKELTVNGITQAVQKALESR